MAQVADDKIGDERSEVYVTAVSEQCAESDEYWTARRRQLEQLRSECKSEAEYEIEKSREHWTEVGAPCSEDDLLHITNRQHFQRLLDEDTQSLRDYPRDKFLDYIYKRPFFVDYGDDLVVGEKIGEGGQAEIFNAAIAGKDEYVLKVLKPGFSIADLERHWTIRVARDGRRGFYWRNNACDIQDHCCYMESGTLLRDGNFAFVMQRYWGDLRKLIDRNMLANNGLGPPFPFPQAVKIMYWIASGMHRVHMSSVVHRDLKASNVLVRLENGVLRDCQVADFECAVGVQGTGFWRAPEVLQAMGKGKDRCRNDSKWAEHWTIDVYSYAMTCYEVLTGRIPFGDLVGTRDDYDVVIRGARPLLPDYIDHNIQDLLKRCWKGDSDKPWFRSWLRPSFESIEKELKEKFPQYL